VTPGPKVLSLDDKVMDYFGKFKAELRRKGQLIGDLLIASVAVSNNLTLVTNNTRHFERISELSLENWLTESTTEK
jgi:tRNA(fMet)-specific endonuclease VapC